MKQRKKTKGAGALVHLVRVSAFWLRAARAPFLPASLMSVAIGTLAAWRTGAGIDAATLAVTAAGIALTHLGVNLVNDYFDAVGSDPVNQHRSPYNGGSGTIQSGQTTRAAVARAGLACLVGACVAGVFLAITRGPGVWVLMVVGGLLGVGYSAPPLGLMGTGWGELVAGLCCGPLVALGANYVQTGLVDASVLWPSIPVGLLVSAILVINEVPDIAADAAAGKANLVVRLGPRAGARLYAALVGVAYVWVLTVTAAGLLPRGAAMVLLTLPVALGSVRRGLRNADQPEGIVPASAGTVAVHALVSIVLASSYVW